MHITKNTQVIKNQILLSAIISPKEKGGDSTASTSTKKSSNKKDGTAKAKRTASTSPKSSNNEKDGPLL